MEAKREHQIPRSLNAQNTLCVRSPSRHGLLWLESERGTYRLGWAELRGREEPVGKGWTWVETECERRLGRRLGEFKGSRRKEKVKGRLPRDAIVIKTSPGSLEPMLTYDLPHWEVGPS